MQIPLASLCCAWLPKEVTLGTTTLKLARRHSKDSKWAVMDSLRIFHYTGLISLPSADTTFILLPRLPFLTNTPLSFVIHFLPTQVPLYMDDLGEAGNAWYSMKEYDPFNLKVL
jgi:hypothetical protein